MKSIQITGRGRYLPKTKIDNKYFKIVEFLEEATIYRDDDFTLFTCNNKDDIYVGNKDMQYNGECS